MSPRLRRLPVRLGRLSLGGLSEEAARESLAHAVNTLIDHAADRVVVLPEMDPSTDPEDGELLFTGEALFLCLGGEYKQICLEPCLTWEEVIEVVGTGGGGDGALAQAREIIYTTLELTEADTDLELIAGTAGYRTYLVYLEMSNASDSPRIAFLKFTAGDPYLFQCYLAKQGGTIVQNFFGAEVNTGDSGDDLRVFHDQAGTGSIYITVGYFLVEA